MKMTKPKAALAVVLAAGLAGLGAGPAAEGQQAPRPDAGAAARWQSVLRSADPDRHTVGQGVWRRQGDKLTGYPAAHGARLRVPVVPKGDYELRARWQPRSAGSGVHFIVPHGDRMASVEILTGFGWAGLGDLNGVRPDVNETRTAVTITAGKVYDVWVRVQVTGDQVHVLARLDGRTVVDWEGKRAELAHEFYAPPGPASLGLAVSGDASTFHGLELRMLSGRAEEWQAPLPAGAAQ